MTALVVEDNPSVARFLAGRLHSEGFEDVLTVADAWVGIRIVLYSPRPPDLVVCDVRLPDFDGLETLTLFRALPKLRKTELRAVTTLQGPELEKYKKLCHERGFPLERLT